MRILVTGAGGFVGRALVEKLEAEGHAVRAVTRRLLPNPPAESCLVPDIVTADWPPMLAGIDQIVHLAARVHQMRDDSADPLAEFRRINCDATLRLAEAAVQAGVQRFVFLSSVKAAIDSTGLDPIDEKVLANPRSDYGLSKLEAERGLLALAGLNGFEPVILRPPLIYGPGAKGNLRALFKLMRSVVPLPLAALDNRRSLLGLSNLVQAIELALQVPGLGGETFYLQDATLSTPALLRAVAEALRRPARLFPMPAVWLAGAARLAGQADKFERLAGSLAISSAKFTRLTGWQPAIPLAVELERIAASPYL